MASPLSPEERAAREVKILRLAAKGKTLFEIGEVLFLSKGTLNKDVQAMYRKMKARNMQHAISIAWATGILKAGDERGD